MYQLIQGQRSNSVAYKESEPPILTLYIGYQGRMLFNAKAVKDFGFNPGEKIQFFSGESKVAFKPNPDAHFGCCVFQPYKSNKSLRVTSKPIANVIREIYGIDANKVAKFKIERNKEFFELIHLTN
jgi:hypothetical protein